MRACALTRSAGREIGDLRHARLAPPVEIDHASRHEEKRRDAHDVVADVVDQLIVARGARAQHFSLQMPVISGRIERPQFALERSLGAVFVDHGVPADPVVRRLDQGKRKIAQRVFVLGEVIGGDRRTGAGRSFLADPGMNIVGDERIAQPAEIADAGAAGKREQRKDGKDGRPVIASAPARCDMAKSRSAPPHPSAAAVVRRRVRVGLGFFSARIDVPFDPDHRQNDDRCGFICRIATEAHNAPLVRKFDNVAHQPLSSAAGKEAFCPDARKSASP